MNLNQKIQSFLTKQKNNMRRLSVTALLSVLIALAVVSSLIMPAISMTMSTMVSSSRMNDGIAIYTATAGTPSVIPDTNMLDLTSADTWTASMSSGDTYFYEANNEGVKTNEAFTSYTDSVNLSVYIKYLFNQDIKSFLKDAGDGPHLGWYLGNESLTADFGEEKSGTVGDPNYSNDEAAGIYIIENGYVKITLTKAYIDYVNAGTGAIEGELDFSGVLKQSETGSGDQSFTLNGQEVIVKFPDQYPTLGKTSKVNTDGTITWTISINNVGMLDLSGYDLTDDMLSGASNVTISPSAVGTYENGEFIFNAEETKKNQWITITYTTPITEEQLKKSSVANSANLTDGTTNIPGSTTAWLNNPFTVDKSGAQDYKSGTYGDKINWTIKVQSNYGTSLDGYIIEDKNIPDGTALTVSDGTITSLGDGRWQLSTTASEVAITYSAAAAEGDNENTASLLYPDGNPTNAKDTDTVPYDKVENIIHVEKTGFVDNGDGTIDWTIKISNPYGLTLDGDTLTDDMLASAVGGTVSISPEGAGAYSNGTVTLTGNAAEINVKYTTEITDAQLKAKNAENTAKLKHGDDSITDEADVPLIDPFDVVKSGTPDYETGTYEHKINWTVTVTSKYGTSLDGYTISDAKIPTNADGVTVTGGKLTYDSASGEWTISETTGNKVTITYTSDAADGKNDNTAALNYPNDGGEADKGETTVDYSDESGIITVTKSSGKDTTDGQIDWTIQIDNQKKLDLAGYTLTDDMLKDAVNGSVVFTPAGAGTYSNGTVTLTDATKGERYITIKYSTVVTEAQLKAGSVTNTAKLKTDEGNDVDDDSQTESFDKPQFNVSKTGTPDYETGTHGNKIKWRVAISSVYGSSLDGYIVTDPLIPSTGATVSPSGTLTAHATIENSWVLGGTNGANTVYLTYETDAVGGQTYSNTAGLSYSDGTGTGVSGSSGNIYYNKASELISMSKNGTYSQDSHEITWNVYIRVQGGYSLDGYEVTDAQFPTSIDEITFWPTEAKNHATLTNGVLTFSGDYSADVTLQYKTTVEMSDIAAGTTVVTNEIDDSVQTSTTVATVTVNNRNTLTKNRTSGGSEYVNHSGKLVRTINWTADIVLDGMFEGKVYTDTLDVSAFDKNGTAVSASHTITDAQMSAIRIYAKTTQWGAQTTLVLNTDYIVARTGNGFTITFNKTLDDAKYNYITISYSTTATAEAVSGVEYPVTYTFGNFADFNGNESNPDDFVLTRNDPEIHTKLKFSVAKNWAGYNTTETVNDRPEKIYVKILYHTNTDNTTRALKKASDGTYLYYGDDGYASAADYIVEIDSSVGNTTIALEGLRKERALANEDGSRGSSTYYYYKVEEVNADGTEIENNVFETETGSYQVGYTNNNGINYDGTATITNTLYRTVAHTPQKLWWGDEGSGDGIASVAVQLEYRTTTDNYNYSSYYPVKIDASGEYVFDAGGTTEGAAVAAQNITSANDWVGTSWEDLPQFIIIDGTVHYCSYRIVETAYTTMPSGDIPSQTIEITGDRFAVNGGYYAVGYSITNGNLSVTNTFKADVKLTVNANKVWAGDDEYIQSDRPEAILVKLQQKSSLTNAWTDYEADPVELTEANSWSYSWGDLPNQAVVTDEQGSSIANYTYRVVEIGYKKGDKTVTFSGDTTNSFAVTGGGKYMISYSNGSWSSNELVQGSGGTITVTNTFTPVGTIDITPQKKWTGDADFAATNRPTSITFTLQRKIGSGKWETVKDENNNAITVTLTSNENDTIGTDFVNNETVVTTFWTGETISGLPERVLVLGENGTYTEQVCQYQLVETSYVLGGTSYDITDGSTKFSTANGTYKITTSTTTSSGILTNTNTFDESIGIIKTIIDSNGNPIESIDVEDLLDEESPYRKTINGVDYYVFNWRIQYDCDPSNVSKLLPISDKLPTNFTLCTSIDEYYYVLASDPAKTTYGLTYGETGIGSWGSADILTPLDPNVTKGCNIDGGGFYANPCALWENAKGVNYIAPTTKRDYAWMDIGVSPSRYYYEEVNNNGTINGTINFGIPACTEVLSFLYSTKIECTVLEKELQNGGYTVSNYAIKHDEDGTPTDKTATASLRIINPIDTKLINKTYQGKTNTPGEIKFALNINPDGKNLSTGSTIDIQDVFDTVSYKDADVGGTGGTLYDATTNPDNYRKLVDVLMSNMKFYEVDSNGNKLALSSSDYTMLFETGSETGNGAVIQLTLPDEKHIIVEYTYKLIANENTPSYINGCKSSTRVNGRYATMAPGMVPPEGDTINFTNTASLISDSASDESTVEETEYKVFKSSGTISTSALPKIKKVNTGDYTIDNLNATFLLAKYENDQWYYATAVDPDEKKRTVTWSAAGQSGTRVDGDAAHIDIETDVAYAIALEEDVLYKLIEIAVPDDPAGYEGSNLGLSDEQFKVLITNYLNDGNTYLNDKDFSIFLENYVSTHYFAYNSTITSYPSEVKADQIMQIKSGGDVEIPNNELIDLDIRKEWVNPVADVNGSEVTLELYWSYEKDSSKIPKDSAVPARAEDLGIMDEDFSATKTITIEYDENGDLITNSDVWTDLPNGKNGKPIYYYVKETAYKIGDTIYTLNDDGKYVAESGEPGAYLPTYTGNAANSDTAIGVRNSYQLMLKKEWKNSDNDLLKNIPVDKVIVSIYGVDADDAKELLFTDVELSASAEWTTDITNLLGNTKLSEYKSFIAEESAGSALDNYVVSCVFNLNAQTGEIIVTNKNTTPTEASVTVDKVWSDGDAMHSTDTITVTLYQLKDNLSDLSDLHMKLSDSDVMKAIDETDEQTYKDVPLNADNDWTYTWTGLPLEDENQNLYYYYVLEEMVEKTETEPGVTNSSKYSASYAIVSQTTSKTEFEITNTRNAITIEKEWLDEDGNTVSNDELPVSEITLDVLKKVPGAPEDGIDILAFGDSITNGDGNGGNGYTGHLKAALESDTYNFTVNNAWKCGHSGWAIMALPGDYDKTGDTRSTWENRSGIYDQISSDFSGKSPDVVTLMIGTNDIISNYPNNIEVRLEKLIKAIYTNQSSNPNMVILVGSIPDFDFVDSSGNAISVNTWFGADKGHNRSGDYADLQKFEDYINDTVIDGYNKKIEALVNKLANEGCKIGFVDINSVVDKDTELYDGCHPNDSGNQDMAKEWAAAIADYYTQTPQVGEITLSAANNWTAAYDIASSDTATEYYVDESSVPAGWKVSYANQNQKLGSRTPITVTNRRYTPTTKLSVEKTWENDKGGESARDAISLTLLQSTDLIEWVEYDVDVEPTPTKVDHYDDDGEYLNTTWTYVYTGLPAENNAGEQYYYKIEEDPMAGYTVSYGTNILEAVDGTISADGTVKTDGNAGTMTLTNTSAIALKLIKEWSDDGHLNDSVIFHVYRAVSGDVSDSDFGETELVLQVSPENVVATVGGEPVKITANKALTEVIPSEGYEEFITYELSPDGKTITVEAEKETDTPVTLTVTDGTDTKVIKITASAYELYFDGDKNFSMRVDETDHKLSVTKGNEAYTAVTYKSDNEDVLTVDATTGEVTGVNIGTASVSVYTNDNLTTPIFTQNIAVGLPEDFTIIQKTGTAQKVTIGSTIELDVDKNYGTFTWESLETTKATVTVDENGTVKVTGVAAGTVKIRATRDPYGDDPALPREFTVTVENGDIFENDNVVVRVPVGETVKITSDTSMGGFDWHDGSIAQTAVSGNTITITGVKAGTVQLTVNNSSWNGKATFTVVVYDKFSVSPATKTLEYGGTATLTPNTTDAVTYTIKSGANLIDISGNTVTAKSGTEGTAVIEAKNTVTGETATVTIEVVAELATISGEIPDSQNNGRTYSYEYDPDLGTIVIEFNEGSSSTNYYINNIKKEEVLKDLIPIKYEITADNGTDIYLYGPGAQWSGFTWDNGVGTVDVSSNPDTTSFANCSSDIGLYANVAPPYTLKIYVKTTSTTSVAAANLSSYGVTMASVPMVLGAGDGIAEQALVGQEIATVTLKGGSADGWQDVLDNLDVYDPSGKPYIYWVVEEHTHTDYKISYLFNDGDAGSNYWINAAEPDENGEYSVIVRNTKEESEGVMMPSTGGEGTAKFYYTGGAMILLGILAGSNRIRRRVRDRRTR